MHDERDETQDTATEPELAEGAVRRERALAVPADEAWALLRDADGLSSWLADEVDLVVEPGEHGTLRDGDGEARPVEVESVEPGRRLSLRWWTESGDEALVDLTLDDLPGGGSRLVVTELPLRVVAMPQAVPADWASSGPAAGPQLRALALA